MWAQWGWEVSPPAPGGEEQAANQYQVTLECRAGLEACECVAVATLRGICHLSPVVLPHHSSCSFIWKQVLLPLQKLPLWTAIGSPLLHDLLLIRCWHFVH